jgi:hypothetical protein
MPKVLVRFLKDMTSAASVGGYLVAPARGPYPQSKPVFAGGQPLVNAEVRNLPDGVAAVLEAAGYVRVLTDPGEIATAELDYAARLKYPRPWDPAGDLYREEQQGKDGIL